MKRSLLLLIFLPTYVWAGGKSNAPAELRLQVRASQSLFEPFNNAEPIRLYLRSTAQCYVTLYQIHPDSGLAILYPQPHHHWRELEAKREYRLAELADDLELKYHDLEGYVYLGIIATREPIHLVPWLEQAFGERGVKIGQKPEKFLDDEVEALVEKVESDVRFRMGEPKESSFALIPVLVHSQTQFYTADWRETPRSQRFYFEGRYHFVTPEPPRNSPGAALRVPSPFPPRKPLPGASTIAPPATKEKPNNVRTPRREKKN
ncbi:DUF4384 domain-containing protein [candidate division KSB1 bacterium]|nr:DUF4384 domain-containing protein [candidate division KSB1 bacterium]